MEIGTKPDISQISFDKYQIWWGPYLIFGKIVKYFVTNIRYGGDAREILGYMAAPQPAGGNFKDGLDIMPPKIF